MWPQLLLQKIHCHSQQNNSNHQIALQLRYWGWSRDVTGWQVTFTDVQTVFILQRTLSSEVPRKGITQNTQIQLILKSKDLM